jgi:HSP20 family protein
MMLNFSFDREMTMTTGRRKPANALTVWQPFRDIENIERSFEDYFGSPLHPTGRRFLSEEMGWSPAINVLEKEGKYLVKVELPGVKDEDIEITSNGDMLTISGEKRTDSEVKKKGYYYAESAFGSFSRSITIPSSVDTNKIEASFDKGILEITLPKAPEVKTKKIKVVAKKKEETKSGK